MVLQTCCFLWSSQIVSKLRVLMALRVCMVQLRFFASCCFFFSVWSCPLLCQLFEEWVHVMPKCFSVRLCVWVFYSVQTCILVLLQRFLWAEIFVKISSFSLGIIFVSEYSYSWRLFGFVESCNTSLCLSLPLLVCPSFWICARVPSTDYPHSESVSLETDSEYLTCDDHNNLGLISICGLLCLSFLIPAQKNIWVFADFLVGWRR